MIKNYISKIVRSVIQEEFEEQRNQIHQEVATALNDITYRTNVLRETGLRGEQRIHTSDLNTATHMYDGYLFSDNKPVAGSVSWTDLNITYKGVTYAITDGNTADKYIWWDFDADDNTKLQTSNTKPSLTVDDVLIGINDGGKFYPQMVAGKIGHGAAQADGSIGSNELGNNAVTTDKIANLAITGGKLDDGAVTETKLGDNAVTGGKIANNAVSSTKLADKAVTSAKLGDGAVTSVKLGNNAVTEGKISNGAVTGTKLGAGAVAEDKLNLATHFIF